MKMAVYSELQLLLKVKVTSCLWYQRLAQMPPHVLLDPCWVILALHYPEVTIPFSKQPYSHPQTQIRSLCIPVLFLGGSLVILVDYWNM